jgi:hypothetical protein
MKHEEASGIDGNPEASSLLWLGFAPIGEHFAVMVGGLFPVFVEITHIPHPVARVVLFVDSASLYPLVTLPFVDKPVLILGCIDLLETPIPVLYIVWRWNLSLLGCFVHRCSYLPRGKE